MHRSPGNNVFWQLNLSDERSLMRESDSELPKGLSESGILSVCENEKGQLCHSEHWYIGEVSKSEVLFLVKDPGSG